MVITNQSIESWDWNRNHTSIEHRGEIGKKCVDGTIYLLLFLQHSLGAFTMKMHCLELILEFFDSESLEFMSQSDLTKKGMGKWFIFIFGEWMQCQCNEHCNLRAFTRSEFIFPSRESHSSTNSHKTPTTERLLTNYTKYCDY